MPPAIRSPMAGDRRPTLASTAPPVSGVFGSIIKTTNVDKILQLDLLATDFYRDAAHTTYLYYNPLRHHEHRWRSISALASRSISTTPRRIDSCARGGRANVLQRAVRRRRDARARSLRRHANQAGTSIARRRRGHRLQRDAAAGQSCAQSRRRRRRDAVASRPGFWNGSLNAEWSTEAAVSPTHSLKLADADPLRSEEWRTFADPIAAGAGRTLTLRWFWQYDTDDEFHARLRLSTDEASGVDLTNPSLVFNFAASGAVRRFRGL